MGWTAPDGICVPMSKTLRNTARLAGECSATGIFRRDGASLRTGLVEHIAGEQLLVEIIRNPSTLTFLKPGAQ